jgi:hypothetical protein
MREDAMKEDKEKSAHNPFWVRIIGPGHTFQSQLDAVDMLIALALIARGKLEFEEKGREERKEIDVRSRREPSLALVTKPSFILSELNLHLSGDDPCDRPPRRGEGGDLKKKRKSSRVRFSCFASPILKDSRRCRRRR